jgi:MYXO-CTERM domain-containing protein
VSQVRDLEEREACVKCASLLVRGASFGGEKEPGWVKEEGTLMSARKIALMTGIAFAIAPVASASVMELNLSTHSSDETLASVLLASFEFSVVGSTLTLTVTNDTLAPNEYDINEVYFNGPDGVGLTPDPLPTDWSFDDSGSMVNGFGVFDFGLKEADTMPDNKILPGNSLSFSFTLSAPADVKDFTTAATSEGFYIAGKFVRGPGDDSAFGATNVIPTPGVLALMGIAGLVAVRPRRRR